MNMIGVHVIKPFFIATDPAYK